MRYPDFVCFLEELQEKASRLPESKFRAKALDHLQESFRILQRDGLEYRHEAVEDLVEGMIYLYRADDLACGVGKTLKKPYYREQVTQDLILRSL